MRRLRKTSRKNVDPEAKRYRVTLYLTRPEMFALRKAAEAAWPRTPRGRVRVGVAATALVRYAMEHAHEVLRPQDMKMLAAHANADRLRVKKRKLIRAVAG